MITKYIIMCGGDYSDISIIPRQFIEINGERIIDRTIRLLKNYGIKDINISTNNDLFKNLNVTILSDANNDYVHGIGHGCWLDAFYPTDENCVYIFGDVYYTENAMKTIVDLSNRNNGEIILCGTGIAKNKQHKNWGEPFSFIVGDINKFMHAVKTVKQMWLDGKVNRMPITWEVYRYLNNYDVNIQMINDDTYVCIDDDTIDIDNISMVDILNKKIINSKI